MIQVTVSNNISINIWMGEWTKNSKRFDQLEQLKSIDKNSSCSATILTIVHELLNEFIKIINLSNITLTNRDDVPNFNINWFLNESIQLIQLNDISQCPFVCVFAQIEILRF